MVAFSFLTFQQTEDNLTINLSSLAFNFSSEMDLL